MVVRRALAIALATCTASIASASRAADRSMDLREAQELFEQSAGEFRDGHFREAIDHLTRAYGLTHQPVLLYNIARAYEELRERPEAIAAYERYLREQPAPEDRAAVETKIASLRAEEEQAARSQREDVGQRTLPSPPPPPPPPAPVVAPPSSSSSLLPWIVTASGGAVALGGVVFVVLGANQHGQALTEPTQVRTADLNRTASTDATIANVLVVAGGAIAAAGLLWAWLGARHPSARTASLAAAVGPGWVGACAAFP